MFGKKDWKECLDPESKELLKKLLESADKHRCAWLRADDVKVAQLWSALIELKKEIDRMQILVQPWKSIIELGELEKKKTIERIVTDILQPKDKEQKEIVDKLVESLMKF